ncbi:SCP2 sterol-binding domain-containing protein [Shewanella avicenniae]|uniref:Ubiquinone biosynthesis accessory factor UbiT n=1 Tax=Shewanella avicenniae TaxID=2814294 RepID=A0ABX7QVS3_9GAMM|nr:SCP2 sterol-binding domain-containing protein [Shewanella avicenniae]QSX34746.1 SCP2 sterol-binding domain-containing protein [Shewanella avicenniae]
MQGLFVSKMAASLLKNAPQVAAKPLAVIPFTIKQLALTQLTQTLLKEALEQRCLDFMQGKWVAIEITDVQLKFELSYQNGRLIVRPPQCPDVTFSARSDELLLIAAGKEDPDSLFFRRQLWIEGDTELGLQVKNLLSSLDPEKLSPIIRFGLGYSAQLLLWLQQQAATTPSLSTP